MGREKKPRVALGALSFALLAGCGDGGPSRIGEEALVVVSPHPDDESIFGAATIHRLAADSRRFVRAVYVSGGDKSSVPGDCNGIPEDEKTERIVALREDETRAAWRVMAPDREVPLDFERGPDQGLVSASPLVGGVRSDTLTIAGEVAVSGAVAAATDLPGETRRVLILTASRFDGHPDHRTAYFAAREAGSQLGSRGMEVTLRSWIVHDEFPLTWVPACCGGDFHWPAAGPANDYEALVDVPSRPRPPRWDVVEDASQPPGIRGDALDQHVSQVAGNPDLCMPVYIPSFYARWREKIEEPFYEERF